MTKQMSRRIAAVSLVSALSFTLVACPSSDDQDSVVNESESPENEHESENPEDPEKENPEKEKEKENPEDPEKENPENESPES